MSLFGKVFDERFFAHRYRSTSYGGIAGGTVAMLLFLYRYLADSVWSWDLLAVGITMVVVKWAFMVFYYTTE